MNYYLAVDGGGTKTHVICTDENGQIIGEGMSGPTSLTATNAGAASFNLREAVRQATQSLPPTTPITNLVMGLAGLDSPEESEQATRIFTEVLQHFNVQKIVIVNDIVIALTNGTDAKNAMALISGTGSNCFGRNENGETAKTSGMDYLLSDQGSGYSIGRAVLRKAVKSFDGRGAKTELEQFVCEHFRINSIAELKPKIHQPPLSKTEIADLSQLCLRAFDQGDLVAKQIFDHNIEELVLMASAVMSRLMLFDHQTDLVLAGSVTKIAYVQSELIAKLKRRHMNLNVIVPTQAPVHGALKMVLSNAMV